VKIPVGKSPTAIAIDSIRNKLYVANQKDDTISIIDIHPDCIEKIKVYLSKKQPCEQNTISVSVGKSPTALAIDTSTHSTYVTTSGNNNILRIQVP
jgi:DNA-binding beta-propeller fold protein YncE